MFRLARESDPRWARAAPEFLPELLLEHAHLERKAAATALTLSFRYPEHAFLQRPLSELAREELSHFEAVLAQLERRGIAFGRQRPNDYASRLLRLVRSQEPQRLLDQLLCAAVIEARSCERMKLLAAALATPEPELSAFYQGLVQSEARHYHCYVDFAERLFAAAEVGQRLDEICAQEAELLCGAVQADRLHGRDGRLEVADE